MQSLRSELYSVVTVEGFTTHHIGALTGRIVLYMELRGFRLRFQSPFCEVLNSALYFSKTQVVSILLLIDDIIPLKSVIRIHIVDICRLFFMVMGNLKGQLLEFKWLFGNYFSCTGKAKIKLSRPFFDLHMPGHDASCVLVDASDQEEYRIKYLVAKSLFSGGWGAFSIAHRLLEGDLFCGLEELYFAVFSIGMGYIGIGKGESMGLKHASAVCSNASP
ncbi:hypothetical protein RHGRI_025105 [Rhododendron griersonianum]|uniref:Uncharacterized protein n=1 Tax=Rhododendron griersonianum TaxID=479676 RepID=A0AAV6J9N5_9ERIC|nr:hypothetical protein RHGRI_025105 [Rhododendron griersonianum]